MTWWTVINPSAGGRRDAAARTGRALDALGIDADLHVSEDASQLADRVADAIRAGHDRFLAVGGDGTANLVVNALLRHSWAEPPLLGILPAGSGCDFIRTFGIPQRLEDAAGHLLGDDTRLVDVGLLEGPWGNRYFLNAAGSGLTANIAATAERLPSRLGAVRHRLAIWPTLLRFPRSEIELQAGELSYRGPAIMVVFANAKFVAGGMKIAPDTAPDDGVLNIQVFTGPKRQAIILKPRVQRGTHLGHRGVRLLEAAEFTLHTDPEWPVEADGEYLGTGQLRGSVIPKALRVKV
ncbi:MAG: diacylglycerol/lipid kinase family protein [Acidimicrobiia bacterium]